MARACLRGGRGLNRVRDWGTLRVFRGPALGGVFAHDEVRLLVNRRLLRLEPHRGTERIELTHDLLTRVIREHRDQEARTPAGVQADEAAGHQGCGRNGLVLLPVILFSLYRKAEHSAAEAGEQKARAETALVDADLEKALDAVHNNVSWRALTHLARSALFKRLYRE